MPISLSPEQRSMRARIAAHTRWSKNDPVEGTAKARASFLQRFDDAVDPDRVLPEAERVRRAESARKAYMAKLALASSKARAKKRAAT